MSPSNHWKLGAFVVVSFAIALGTLAWLGAKQFETEEDTIHLFFDETVDGLTVGSEVRFRGMPVGTVSEIRTAPDKVRIEVVAKISVSTLKELGLRRKGEAPDYDQLGSIRAQLVRNALTGLAVINADRFDSKKHPPPDYGFEVPPYTIHTVPSTFKGLIADLAASLEEIPTTIKDLDGLIQELQGVAQRVDRSIVDLDVAGLSKAAREVLEQFKQSADRLTTTGDATLEEAQETIEGIGSFVTKLGDKDGELSHLLASIERTLAPYEQLGIDLDEELKKAKIGETTEAARGTLTAIGTAGDQVGALSDSVRQDLNTVVQAIEAIRRLVEMLERDPGALLHGKTTPPSPRQGE